MTRHMTRHDPPYSASTRRRNPRTPRNCANPSRCAPHATHRFSRSGVCTFGLFHTSTHTASARHPFAEHTAIPSTPPVCSRPPTAARSRPSQQVPCPARGAPEVPPEV
jgi:hypothetical protein